MENFNPETPIPFYHWGGLGTLIPLMHAGAV